MTQKNHTESRHNVTFFSVHVASRENLCSLFYRILAKESIAWASCGIFIEKTDEISGTLHWCTKSFQNKCHSVCVILRQQLTENNLRKLIVRYDRCQRRVADKTYRFLIENATNHEGSFTRKLRRSLCQVSFWSTLKKRMVLWIQAWYLSTPHVANSGELL
jgi:hypothetical protein